MKVSIIIRAKNEERWVSPCLKAIFEQSFKDFEVILVDNCSTDNTVVKARQFDVKVLTIKEYLPGKALNMGIKASRGEFVASLSAHCIPKGPDWLRNLLRNFDDPHVAGVYGRQEPMNRTSDLDKRDLLIVFGLDKKIQTKDSFFHNANSMIRRSVWETLLFDETVTNIEDRLWGKQVIEEKYKLVYEPEASVYHYHGIHQSADPKRCRDIVRVMESIEPVSKKEISFIRDMNIIALIPLKGDVTYLCGRPLVEYAIERAKESEFIDRVIVSTDNPEIAKIAKRCGAETPFLRPAELSSADVGIEKVLQYSLAEIEKQGMLADLIVYIGVHAPFRPTDLIDTLIELLFHNGFDSALPGQPIYNSCWHKENGGFHRIDEGFIPRKTKKPVYIGHPALCCVNYPEFIRDGRLLGDNVGIFEITDRFLTMEIADKASHELAEKIFSDWWAKQKKKAEVTL